MTRGILIAGNESSLCNTLAAEAAKRVEHFAIAVIPSRLSHTPHGKADTPAEKASLSLQWNPSSPISARTLVLAAENRLGQINEAILVCSPPSIRRPAAELSLSEIETLVNDHIKGWFFLARELAVVFRAKQSGTLALVFSEVAPASAKDDVADLLGPCALASFQGFARSLCASAIAEPYLTMGFSNSDASAEAAFASFVFKYLDEGNTRNNGKLYKYGKLNLFK